MGVGGRRQARHVAAASLTVAATAAAATLACALLCATPALAGKPRDWSKFRESDWEAVDNDWREGDEEEELVTEDELEVRRMEARRAAAPNVSPEQLEVMPTEALEYIKQSEAQAGPTMMFAALTDVNAATGKPWTDDERNELAFQWRDLLATNGVTVTCYDIGDNRVLTTLQHGWRGFELLRFLLDQPDATEVEWNQHTYRAGDMVP
eukprot:CAMPEP_0203820974 /NCGR_PEP_ID=MMETSP0115-20131106/41663_1 /ASSEMBLY_ACC=CAM_ASM_000227 /TAXON_ID=33651 /ORGANISM="Bicosoecid sp, Strain ms1" /LENGTH=207 /DNA_ID=CAMNT_0050729993 /DNA_START=38 /DNA_END=658 /DNA_ORIENTATION=-